MRIVIDAYQATATITGSDRFAHNILRELQQIDHENHYTIIVNAEHDFISNVIEAPNFTVMPLRISKRAIWLMLGLPRILKRQKADVFYSPYNLSGPGYKTCRTIISILDTIPIARPDLYFASRNSKLREAIVSFTMQRPLKIADQFVAISNFTKQRAVADLGLNAAQIKVIYLQADPVFFQRASIGSRNRARKKYHLPKQYVFTMGSSEPRKNVVSLVKAHQLLPATLREDYPLIISGKRWHGRDIDITDDPFITMAGFIDDQDLPTLYQLASLFAFPSTYEGFGLPILEAMASGTAVLTTTATSIPEVAGEAAVLVNATDVEEMSRALRELLEHPDRRAELVKRGNQQVSRFSWTTAAQELLKLIEKTTSK
jgi:glycosyltransferase involved in cell wall biosynthesis